MEGWVSIHRRILNHWTYTEKREFSRFEAWIDLILTANHCDTRFPLGNEIVEAKRGDVITSELKLMERWGWGKTKVRNFLELLEKDGMIVKKSDRKKTTISLVNYGQFQVSDTTDKPQANHEQTTSKPRAYTINNVNNENNENKLNITTTTIAAKNPFAMYEQLGFGKLDEYSAEFVGKAVDFYTEDWVKRAMVIAYKKKITAWAYVEGILNSWKATGSDKPWEREKEKPQRAPSGKPKLAVFNNTDPSTSLSEDKLRELREKAKQRDARKEGSHVRSLL